MLSKGVPYPGQTVTWSAGSGAAVASATSVSNANGIAWTQVTAGPLAAASAATVYACLAGGVPGGKGCASFTIVSVDPSTAGLIAVSGTSQTLASGDPLAPGRPASRRFVRRPNGRGRGYFLRNLAPMDAAMSRHKGAAQAAPVLATQTVEATSDANGVVTLTPLTDGIVATQLEALAVTGTAPP